MMHKQQRHHFDW